MMIQVIQKTCAHLEHVRHESGKKKKKIASDTRVWRNDFRVVVPP